MYIDGKRERFNFHFHTKSFTVNKVTSPVVTFIHCLARFYYFIYLSYCKPLKDC